MFRSDFTLHYLAKASDLVVDLTYDFLTAHKNCVRYVCFFFTISYVFIQFSKKIETVKIVELDLEFGKFRNLNLVIGIVNSEGKSFMTSFS